MDFIERVLEQLKDWANKLIELLLGPEAEPQSEPIPIPVDDSPAGTLRERARRTR